MLLLLMWFSFFFFFFFLFFFFIYFFLLYIFFYYIFSFIIHFVLLYFYTIFKRAQTKLWPFEFHGQLSAAKFAVVWPCENVGCHVLYDSCQPLQFITAITDARFVKIFLFFCLNKTYYFCFLALNSFLKWQIF